MVPIIYLRGRGRKGSQMINLSIFVSHSWAYAGDYDKITEWLCHENWNLSGTPIIFNDVSVPRDNPIHNAPNEELLKQQIFQRIWQSNVVVIPTGVYASYSKWIGKEIEGAKAYSKPIVAVDGWGAQRTSAIVQEAATVRVGWQKQSVVNAVFHQARANL